MRSGFLVVVADAGAVLPPTAAALAASPAPEGLTFVPAARVGWRSSDGRTLVAAWQERPVEEGTTWAVTDDGIAVVSGHLRRRGDPWLAASAWPGLAAAELRGRPPGAADDLEGEFAAAAVAPDGSGVVASDVLGLRFLFEGRGEGVVAVGSHAGLVAGALAPAGRRPARDALAASWLAYTRHWVGDRTGYAGVRLLRPGTTVALTPDGAPSRVERPGWWEPAAPPGSVRPEEAAEPVLAAIADSMAALSTYPAPDHEVDLTGGRDSRLMLAGALAGGVAGDLRFRTLGGRRVADVVVASELAAELGLEHAFGIRAGQHAGTYPQRLAWFVEATGGMCSTWRLRWPSVDPPPSVHANGLLGEPLRRVGVLWLPEDRQQVVRLLTGRAGSLGLLRPEAAAWCRDELTRLLLDDQHLPSSPADLPDVFRLLSTVRHNFGPRDELGGRPDIHPLYSATALRQAFAVGPVARRRQLLHRACLAAVDQRLVDHRLAGGSWPPTADDDVAVPRWVREGRPAPRRVGRPVDRSGKLAGPLVFGATDDVVAATLRSVLDQPSGVWEVLDRDRVVGAAERYGELTTAGRQELHGAATAALWMAEPSA